MKNKLIWTIVIAILVVGGIIYAINKQYSNAASMDNLVDSTLLSSSTLAALTVEQPVSTSTSAVQEDPNKEQIADFEFKCDEEKIIKARLYIAGKDPRADLIIFDNTQTSEGQPNEARRIILKQRVAASGVKYATDKETIIFTAKEKGAQLVENGRIIFKNCVQQVVENS